MSALKEGKGPSSANPPDEDTTVQIHLRPAREEDVPTLVPLLLRLKRLNEEFDPLLRVRDDAEQQARQILTADLANPKAIVMVAEGVGSDREKIVGFSRAHVRERAFYAPEHEGVILDIYLLPLYRRRGAGEFVLQKMSDALRAKGAGLVTAEFPARNEIASRFYSKRGFRSITVVQARSLDGT
jgi:ribosomal protein S18 acetylase RimI-like enzyme